VPVRAPHLNSCVYPGIWFGSAAQLAPACRGQDDEDDDED
jgi:hypothetical protein